jgi:hypothetical protein
MFKYLGSEKVYIRYGSVANPKKIQRVYFCREIVFLWNTHFPIQLFFTQIRLLWSIFLISHIIIVQKILVVIVNEKLHRSFISIDYNYENPERSGGTLS